MIVDNLPYFFKIHFSIIHPPAVKSPKWFHLYAFLIPGMLATGPINLVFDLNIVILIRNTNFEALAVMFPYLFVT